MNINNRLLVEKGIFSKEEFLEVVRVVDQDMKMKRRRRRKVFLILIGT